MRSFAGSLVLAAALCGGCRSPLAEPRVRAPNQAPVLALRQDMVRGDTLRHELLGVRHVAVGNLPSGYLGPHEGRAVVGRKLNRNLTAGSVLRRAYLQPDADAQPRF